MYFFSSIELPCPHVLDALEDKRNGSWYRNSGLDGLGGMFFGFHVDLVTSEWGVRVVADAQVVRVRSKYIHDHILCLRTRNLGMMACSGHEFSRVLM